MYPLPYRGNGPDCELLSTTDFLNPDYIAKYCVGLLDGRWTATDEVEETEEDIWG
jgi:hypothetical protein